MTDEKFFGRQMSETELNKVTGGMKNYRKPASANTHDEQPPHIPSIDPAHEVSVLEPLTFMVK